MRDRSIDEFESIFEKASIPVFEIPDVEIKNISAVLKGDPLDGAAIALAEYLKDRFAAEVLLHWSHRADRREVMALAERYEFQPAAQAFADTRQLIGQVDQADSHIVLLPEPSREEDRLLDLDPLVEELEPPVMILRSQIENPRQCFARVLRVLTGKFQHTRNFSYAFALTEPKGLLELLHTVHEEEIADVRGALSVSPEVPDEVGEDLLQEIARQGERYLKGVALSGKAQPFEIRYRVLVGHVLDLVQKEVELGNYGMVIVGRHREGKSHVEADVYQLMHLVRSVPVLAI